ncbi:MAG: M4 family metallopeptidase [bacterium]
MCNRIPHHSILCILPPYVLRNIAQNGTPQQRQDAMQTLATDTTMRAIRAVKRTPPIVALATAPMLPMTMEARRQRAIYDAQHHQNLPGALVRKEGDAATGDAAADEAYDGLGATFDFFWEIYERNSLDDEGLLLTATVHFGKDYSNAFWDGQRMVFGDGDAYLFNRFTSSLDVIAHELAHGVTEDEARLIYFFQSGALNESMSDVFGTLVKQRLRKQNAREADWLIGAELLTSKVEGVALRSMKDPGTAFDDPLLGKDPQPKHMKDFVRTYEDNGGVHINSGIPNHAFYLLANHFGGYAWEKAGRIWYETLRDSKLRPNTGFLRFARLTIDNAGRLFGVNCAEQKAVREAWLQVGMKLN